MFADVVTGNAYCVSLFTMKDKQSKVVCMAEDDPRSETGFRSRKRIFSIFFNTLRSVVLDLKPHKVRSLPHATPPPFYQRSFSTQRRRSGLLLHHACAVPHKDHLAESYLDEENIHLVEHPPYSSDLTPCDLWLFPKINSKLVERETFLNDTGFC